MLKDCVSKKQRFLYFGLSKIKLLSKIYWFFKRPSFDNRDNLDDMELIKKHA